MSKRSAKEKIVYYSAKIQKLKDRDIDKKRRRLIVYTSSDSDENSVNEAQYIEDPGAPAQSPPMFPPSPPLSPPPQTSPPPPPLPLLAPSSFTPPGEIITTSDEPNTKLVPELEPELLEALGDVCDEAPIYGPEIHSKLAERWLTILKKGLESDQKDKLLKEYSVPENCKFLKAPLINAEISAAVADIVRNRDKKLQSKQDQLGLGITAINRAMSLLLTSDDKVQAIKKLSDGCRLLTVLHFMETQIRAKLITPGLEKAFLSIIQDQERDEALFGNKLSENIKASKAIEKQGLQIKKLHQKPSSTSSPRFQNQGNWSGPSRYPTSRRGGRTSSYKITAQQQSYRRNQTAPLPLLPPPAPSTRSTSYNKRAPSRH